VDLLADLRLVGVEQRDDLEPAAGEPVVPGEGVTEITDANQADGPPLVEAENVLDLLDQQGDVVADPASAVRPEVREVLAKFRRVDPGGRGETLAGDRVGAALGEVVQCAKVFGQPGDRRLREIREGRDVARSSGRASVTLLTHLTPCRRGAEPFGASPLTPSSTGCDSGALRSHRVGACEGVHKSRSWCGRWTEIH
jgi:hypothetical protein